MDRGKIVGGILKYMGIVKIVLFILTLLLSISIMWVVLAAVIIFAGGYTTTDPTLMKVFFPIKSSIPWFFAFTVLGVVTKFFYKRIRLKKILIVSLVLYLLVAIGSLIYSFILWGSIERFDVYPKTNNKRYVFTPSGIDNQSSIQITFETDATPKEVINYFSQKFGVLPLPVISPQNFSSLDLGKVSISAYVQTNGTTKVSLSKSP